MAAELPRLHALEWLAAWTRTETGAWCCDFGLGVLACGPMFGFAWYTGWL